MDSWAEGGVAYFHDLRQGELYCALPEGLEKHKADRPALPLNTKGIIKYRQGTWWLLVPELGHDPEDQVSSLSRFDAQQKQWVLIRELDIRASNFEPLQDGSFILAGVYAVEKAKRNIAAILSSSGTLSLLDEIPFKAFEDMLWRDCITTVKRHQS